MLYTYIIDTQPNHQQNEYLTCPVEVVSSQLTHEVLLIFLAEALGILYPPLPHLTSKNNVYQPTMESDQANPGTQIEVDIMILDYLLCIAIDTALHGRAAKQQDQAESWDANWVLNSVHSKSKYPRKYHTDAGYPSVPY